MHKFKHKMFLILVILLFSILILQIISLSMKNKPNKVVKIGVIDSLITDKCLGKYDIVSGKRLVKDNVINDHGDIMLSIIKQNNNAQIYYISALDSNLTASIDDIVKSIYICIENKVDIINLSLATKEDNPLLRKAIKTAIDNNIIVIAACVNDYKGYSYPANYDGVISVAYEDNYKAKIVLKKEKYFVRLADNSVIQTYGTSCATAFICNEISSELSGKSSAYLLNKLNIKIRKC